MKKAIKISLIVLLTILITILSYILIFVVNSIKEVKDINLSLEANKSLNCQIYNKDNEIINDYSIYRTYVTIDEISPITIDAFLSIEDKKFYDHDGLNYLRIGKALLNNVKAGKVVEGASTITQQLIKNKFLSNEKTLKRKVKEAYLTKKIEKLENKDKILESYLNTIYFGNGAYGIGDASLKFFGKSPIDLNLNESCVLAGLVKSPNTYSPINNIEASTKRRNIVLKEMLEDNKITTEEYNKVISDDIITNEQQLFNYNEIDLYSQYTLEEASKILNLEKPEIINKGYKIYTYQDSQKQEILDNIISNKNYYEENKYGNIPDSLSIIINNKTSGVSAISGKSKYNLVNFKRQPGSLIKPVFVYTPAIENGLIYPCSMILDEKINFNNYSPRNVSDKYYGYVSIRDAVGKSLNTPSVKICDKLGVEYCKNFVKNCGLEFNESDTGLATALGGLNEGFTLQNITESYLPYTNEGYYSKSKFISKIVSPSGLTIYQDSITKSKYCSPETAYLMTNTMSKNLSQSTSKKLSNFDFDIASKTGTVNVKDSNENTDAFSLAYTSEITMSVWLGNYSMDKEFNLESSNNGGTYCTQIIKDAFDQIYKDNKPEKFSVPNNIVILPIDSITLEKSHEIVLGENIPEKYKIYEVFDKNNLPNKNSTIFEKIDNTNLDYELTNNTCILKFNTLEYLNYKIYRSDNNKFKLLKNISNHNGEFSYIDNTIDFNTNYNYYIEISNNHNNNTAKSNSITIRLNKEYDKVLEKQMDNLSWLFA